MGIGGDGRRGGRAEEEEGETARMKKAGRPGKS